jgi:hypothetical protein
MSDRTKLTAAFRKLNRMGIVARERWQDCSSCGFAMMESEMKRLLGRRKTDIIGVAFYHDQDYDAMMEGKGIYIKFGSISQTDKADASVAKKIVKVLNGEGLTPEWDGDVETAIRVPIKI